jgi:hypothetical protein
MPEAQMETPTDNTDDQESKDAGKREELPEWAVKELDRARKEASNYRTKLREVEPLAEKAKELEEAQKSETQRLMERVEAAEVESRRLESAVGRLRIAAKHGIPEELADLLGEGDEEALEIRAKALMEWRGQSPSSVPSKPVEATRSTVLAGDETPADPNDWLRQRIKGGQ